MELTRGDVSIRPCSDDDAATLTQWFPDGLERWRVRVVDEFTIWPFTIRHAGVDAGFLQVWRTTDGVGGLEIFISPPYRRQALATGALKLTAQHLREGLGWDQVTVEPHSDDDAAIACCAKAGFVDRGRRRDDGDHSHVILEWP